MAIKVTHMTGGDTSVPTKVCPECRGRTGRVAMTTPAGCTSGTSSQWWTPCERCGGSGRVVAT